MAMKYTIEITPLTDSASKIFPLAKTRLTQCMPEETAVIVVQPAKSCFLPPPQMKKLSDWCAGYFHANLDYFFSVVDDQLNDDVGEIFWQKLTFFLNKEEIFSKDSVLKSIAGVSAIVTKYDQLLAFSIGTNRKSIIIDNFSNTKLYILDGHKEISPEMPLSIGLEKQLIDPENGSFVLLGRGLQFSLYSFQGEALLPAISGQFPAFALMFRYSENYAPFSPLEYQCLKYFADDFAKLF